MALMLILWVWIDNYGNCEICGCSGVWGLISHEARHSLLCKLRMPICWQLLQLPWELAGEWDVGECRHKKVVTQCRCVCVCHVNQWDRQRRPMAVRCAGCRRARWRQDASSNCTPLASAAALLAGDMMMMMMMTMLGEHTSSSCPATGWWRH